MTEPHSPPGPTIIKWKCPACGTRARVPSDTPRVFCWCGFTHPHAVPGLGDHLAAALHTAGITEQRYIALKESLHMTPRCRCQARRAWLNAIGRRLRITAPLPTGPPANP